MATDRAEASPHVFEVTAAGFEQEVLLRSAEVPVLLDFWAEWCGPCRTLGPVLERLADEYGGAFVLGKVDADREAELAQAFRVQSIPFCVLLHEGRPVDAFQGALPEPELRQFLERADIHPQAGGPDSGPPVEEADPDSPEARLREGKLALLRGDFAAARDRLEGVDEDADERAVATCLLDGMGFLEAELPTGSEAAAALERARTELQAGAVEEAAEALLESLAADKGYGEGMARKAILLCFSLMGEGEEVEDRIAALRRRMATLMY